MIFAIGIYVDNAQQLIYYFLLGRAFEIWGSLAKHSQCRHKVFWLFKPAPSHLSASRYKYEIIDEKFISCDNPLQLIVCA